MEGGLSGSSGAANGKAGVFSLITTVGIRFIGTRKSKSRGGVGKFPYKVSRQSVASDSHHNAVKLTLDEVLPVLTTTTTLAISFYFLFILKKNKAHNRHLHFPLLCR